MKPLKKFNKGFQYLLMVIDVFSKYAYGWIKPLKNKSANSVTEVFETILKEGKKPEYLWTDKGKEFYFSNSLIIHKPTRAPHSGRVDEFETQ